MDSAVIVICLNRLNWRGVVHFADVSRQNDPSPGDSLDRGVFGNVQIPLSPYTAQILGFLFSSNALYGVRTPSNSFRGIFCKFEHLFCAFGRDVRKK